MLPLGVVIPTKNSMSYLPGHLENLATWIDLAEQVVVVDSFSTDGSLEFIQANLHHPNISFLSHPPGLYASWNHGIRRVTSEYCYISTVGDSITRAGLEHLVTASQRLECDVLVSRPEFVDEADQPCEGPEWPMDFIIQQLKLREPARLPSHLVLVTAFLHTGGALSGSCSSDLFRTEVLQKAPFPMAYGKAGDGAWSLQNAGLIEWAATPEKISTFRIHPPASAPSEVQAGLATNVSKEFSEMAAKGLAKWLESDSDRVPVELRKNISQLRPVFGEHEKSCRHYTTLRKGKWPWILNPSAWIARGRRNIKSRQLQELVEKIFHPDVAGRPGGRFA